MEVRGVAGIALGVGLGVGLGVAVGVGLGVIGMAVGSEVLLQLTSVKISNTASVMSRKYLE